MRTLGWVPVALAPPDRSPRARGPRHRRDRCRHACRRTGPGRRPSDRHRPLDGSDLPPCPGTRLTSMLIPGTHDSGADGIRDRTPRRPKVIAEPRPCSQRPHRPTLCGGRSGPLRTRTWGAAPGRCALLGHPGRSARRQGHQQTPASRPKDPLSVPLVLQHNFVSHRFTKGLGQVLRADAHPREQIIFDIQHVDLTGDPPSTPTT